MKRPKPMRLTQCRLTDAEIRLARKLGGGNFSKGIRKALELVQQDGGR